MTLRTTDSSAIMILARGVSILVAVLLSGYPFRLSVRTSMFAQSAAVGKDVLFIVGTAALLGLFASVLGFILPPQTRWHDYLMTVINSLLTVTFLTLYLLGKFGPIVPE